MIIGAARFQVLLNDLKLEQLFNEMGWDHAAAHPQQVIINGESFALHAVAQKRSVAVFLCSPDRDGKIPPRATLLKIEKEAAKLAYEHLLIFADAARTALTWLWVSRAPGQPAATRTHTWHNGTSGESLRQKVESIVWSLEQEEAITLTDVITGLRRAFDRDRITRAFYDRFKSEHEAFGDFITGLTNATDKAWYASLMLNRLMFVYFIQRKGFLDGNADYLADRLRAVQTKAGKDKFHSFYRQFLLRLFHEGLGQPKAQRKPDLSSLIGDVPYLNGGLFDLHELEEGNPGIDVPDKTFARLFAFFEGYDWHLDDRPLRSGTEINPDVLGYIFEKYINQKQMGAYYTKEDITEYIAKNTVIPHLLEQARERCKVAFEGEASVWNLLKESPDRYLYPAMKTGVIDAKANAVPESALPHFVQTGMKDAKARMFDNRYNLREAVFTTATGERGTLLTETWREYVERCTRCLAIREKLAKGEVKSADDLVTLNLDIRQFMQDVIDTCGSPDLLRAVWQAIVGRVPEKSNEKFRHGITILDPTCGSGAFLFAALNILEPLYEGCLDRMEGFVEDAKRSTRPPAGEGPGVREGRAENAFPDFIKVLTEVDKHPSRHYFVYKSIILHNLFGVDIMPEAVEICKLRLFLKLVSQVDSASQLEPLPDIDFNIRCGNTLVGYATEAQFDAIGSGNLEYGEQQDHKAEIKASIADLADLFDRFREQQTKHGGEITSEDKRRLREKLNTLGLELDRYLARDYGIDPNRPPDFASWRESYQPFHWFAEFYGVMRAGGFDVVIGNPPWKEYSAVRQFYTLRDYATESCGNLYGLCTERSLALSHDGTRFSFIVQLPLVCSSRMATVRETLRNASAALWVTTFDDRPAKLFDGLQHCRSTIFFVKRGRPHTQTLTTRYQRWPTVNRSVLFATMRFVTEADSTQPGRIIAKHSRPMSASIFKKVRDGRVRNVGAFRVRRETGHYVFYQEATQYWAKATSVVPFYAKNGNRSAPAHGRYIYFDNPVQSGVATALLNSSLFYVYFVAYGDCFHLSDTLATSFPVSPELLEDKKLAALNDRLMSELDSHSERKTITSRRGGSVDRIEYDEYYGARCKDTIDQIDLRLAELYSFTTEENDFIVNYDIKYRMGGANEEE